MSIKSRRIKLNEVEIEVVQKKIKNLHLSVYPPHGRVKVSAPDRMALETIRTYLISKLGWIKKQQEKFRAQKREPVRECLERESHYFKGQRYLLHLEERHAPPHVALSHFRIVLQVRPGSNEDKKRSVLESWYRRQLKEMVAQLVDEWCEKIGVEITNFTIRKMKTKWGSCTPATRSIRINLELAKKPPECLEYIVVHELVHLLEPSHNKHFIALLDHHLPKWRFYRDELNSLPIAHEEWRY